MIRFLKVIIFNFHLIIYHTFKMNKWCKNKEISKEQKHKYGQHIINLVAKKGKITTQSFGEENLPKEDGYILFPNHQGKYDACAIILTHEKPISVLIDKKVCNNPLLNNFLKMTGSKIIDKGNPKQGIRLFKEIEKEAIEGNNFIIFAEGKYTDNHNNLQDFNTGCMKFLYKSHSPIVPVALYDTYKPFGVNSLKKVSCEVHYLTPIYYEEYCDLSKAELAQLIKNRISDKLEEIKMQKNIINKG